MIPRLLVEVSVPRACYEALGDSHAIQTFLQQVGVLSPQAQEIRWRSDMVNPGGYVMAYSVPVMRPVQVLP